MQSKAQETRTKGGTGDGAVVVPLRNVRQRHVVVRHAHLRVVLPERALLDPAHGEGPEGVRKSLGSGVGGQGWEGSGVGGRRMEAMGGIGDRRIRGPSTVGASAFS